VLPFIGVPQRSQTSTSVATVEVAVAAAGAEEGGTGAPAACLLARQHDAVDAVAAALVVDDGARAELGDGDEAGPAQELLLPLLVLARRDISSDRQAREVVAGQEAFGGEVAIAVEVGEDVAPAAAAQQVEL